MGCLNESHVRKFPLDPLGMPLGGWVIGFALIVSIYLEFLGIVITVYPPYPLVIFKKVLLVLVREEVCTLGERSCSKKSGGKGVKTAVSVRVLLVYILVMEVNG
jgi:hypothetical protein